MLQCKMRAGRCDAGQHWKVVTVQSIGVQDLDALGAEIGEPLQILQTGLVFWKTLHDNSRAPARNAVQRAGTNPYDRTYACWLEQAR